MHIHPRLKSILLVGLQFLFIFLLLFGSSFNNLSALVYTFIIPSAALVLWAIASMRKSKLRIFPEPSANATLVTGGPYRFIRHPMYTAVLLGCCGLLANHFTWVRFAMTVGLFIVLIIKLSWEEEMLAQKFDGYRDYMKNTLRLIPFLF